MDYSSINGYYGEWSAYINQHVKVKETKLFTTALLAFKKLLNNQKVTHPFNDEPFDTSIHPILNSRLLSVKIFGKHFLVKLLQYMLQIMMKIV